ncbi:serine-rich adhesin for platelets isoform X2 [Drosophila miranda]|uniref:serine-rich adhesin for platelets isoform X2 n=1 Tax=Drosophila miranda TaxID=7229 RepID=UPI0007E71F18|nr:serine-rich adhesin for platelets isoform X2 [Drosophila miranda]
MSNQLERLLFFIVVISGALCTVEDYVIMSQCAHNKAIHLAAAGTVSVTDISQIQNITIVGLPDYVNNEFKIALYAKETQRYLCFNDNWRLVGMRELRDTCYFNETIVHGYFVFRSVVDLQRRVGFTHRGKPVGPKKTVNDACYMFNKIDAEQFFHQHTLPKWREMAASQMMASNGNGNGSSNGQKPLPLPSRSNKNNRHKSNNQNQKLQPQQEHHGHNNNNSNIIINNSSNSLSSTNKRRLALNRQKQQQQQKQQHQVRHHHNDPSLLARRQQHDKKQKRRRKEQLHQRVTASPTKRATAAATTAATSTSATTTATKWSTATQSIKRKGRRRKGKPKAKPPPVTAATSTSSDDSLYSSSSSSSSGMGYEDPYNASSTSITTLEPWPTWSTIDSFTPDVAGVSSSSSSSSSTTATSDDSISSSSSSNYDAWSTFITELESEAASSATTTTTEMSGNDTELLLQYEAELVEDAETVSTTDYETKGTSAATAATAATTTSTAGTQLVIEQTPLQQELATTLASQTDLAPSTHKLSRHRGGGSGSAGKENHRQWLQGDNKLQQQHQQKFLLPLQPPTGSTRVPSATTPRRRLSLSTSASTVERMKATPPQQHGLIDKVFSVYKNINSNLNNTLTEASPTVDTSRGETVTAATTSTTKKSLRKSTQKLMATPYHQLTYVRNEAGDIDIDNLDNISVYPDLFEGELDVSDSGNGNGNGSISNSRLTFVSGYLATSPTSVLPESIRIAKIKINNERRRLQLHSQRRFA